MRALIPLQEIRDVVTNEYYLFALGAHLVEIRKVGDVIKVCSNHFPEGNGLDLGDRHNRGVGSVLLAIGVEADADRVELQPYQVSQPQGILKFANFSAAQKAFPRKSSSPLEPLF